ncbi:helix-turn-helix domain-containing protein [Nocardia sp. CA2R105]|uniref:helix-turn-helix domain-containing protein n=1 Tax=Nocardia coffeae TaxID=2873381 RepID=UPI001CA624E3|nr:helix-turn-helix transcriptional regulator [Nocardia coffeae]MBY8855401.1 helix-turn-helix domain-containing protein [Nocardia coffeae]
MINSLLEQWELGRRMRSLRKNAKLSQSAAAKAIDVSPQTIGRLEDGQATRISKVLLSELCNFYQAEEHERTVVLKLAQDLRAAQQKGGSTRSGGVSVAMAGLVDRVELEQAASAVTIFANTVVPGLLRTPEYHQINRPARHPHDSAADLECWQQLNEQRRVRLHNNNFDVEVYLLRSVLHHVVGGPALMAQQLAHLEQVSQLPNVTLRVIPSDAGSHIGLHGGGFTLMEFGDLPGIGAVGAPVVYAKGFTEELCIRDHGDINRYRAAVAQLDRVAMSPDESRMLMATIEQKYSTRTTLVLQESR